MQKGSVLNSNFASKGTEPARPCLWAVEGCECNKLQCNEMRRLSRSAELLNQTGDMKQGQGVDTIRVQRTDNKQHLAFSL